MNKIDIKEMADYYNNRLVSNGYNDRFHFSDFFRQQLDWWEARIHFKFKPHYGVRLRMMSIDYTKTNKIFVEGLTGALLTQHRMYSELNIPHCCMSIKKVKDAKNGFDYVIVFNLSINDFVRLFKQYLKFEERNISVCKDKYSNYNEKGEYIS